MVNHKVGESNIALGKNVMGASLGVYTKAEGPVSWLHVENKAKLTPALASHLGLIDINAFSVDDVNTLMRMHLAVANKHFTFYTVCSPAFPARTAPLSWVAGFIGRYNQTVFQWLISHWLVLDELPTTWSTRVFVSFWWMGITINWPGPQLCPRQDISHPSQRCPGVSQVFWSAEFWLLLLQGPGEPCCRQCPRGAATRAQHSLLQLVQHSPGKFIKLKLILEIPTPALGSTSKWALTWCLLGSEGANITIDARFPG